MVRGRAQFRPGLQPCRDTYWNAAVRLGFFPHRHPVAGTLRLALSTQTSLAQRDGLTDIMNARIPHELSRAGPSQPAAKATHGARLFSAWTASRASTTRFNHGVGDQLLQTVAATLVARACAASGPRRTTGWRRVRAAASRNRPGRGTHLLRPESAKASSRLPSRTAGRSVSALAWRFSFAADRRDCRQRSRRPIDVPGQTVGEEQHPVRGIPGPSHPADAPRLHGRRDPRYACCPTGPTRRGPATPHGVQPWIFRRYSTRSSLPSSPSSAAVRSPATSRALARAARATGHCAAHPRRRGVLRRRCRHPLLDPEHFQALLAHPGDASRRRGAVAAHRPRARQPFNSWYSSSPSRACPCNPSSTPAPSPSRIAW